MALSSRRILALAGTAAALAGTVGVAVAGSGTGSSGAAAASGAYGQRPERLPRVDRDAYLDDVAQRAGVTRAQLDAALEAVAGDRGDRGRGREFGLGFGLGHGGAAGGSLLAAAEALDLSFVQLRRELRSKTLAEVARERNRSLDDVKSAMRAAVSEELDAAVADDRLTAAQRTQALERFDATIDDTLNGRSPFVTALARELEIDRDRVVTALRGAALARVDAAERDGDLTAAQADRLRERIREGEGGLGFGGGHHGGHGHGPGGRGPGGGYGLGDHGAMS
jgi:hypothetical protein